MTVRDAAYIRAFMAAEGACHRWKAANPDARPKFNPLPVPALAAGRGGLIGGVDQALMLGVAGNSAARKLLTAIDRAVDRGGATIQMAEYALEQVYGIKHALTRQLAN